MPKCEIPMIYWGRRILSDTPTHEPSIPAMTIGIGNASIPVDEFADDSRTR
jgi:hypothetical protein